MSLPSRERGLKHAASSSRGTAKAVAPFTGAWIETVDFKRIFCLKIVAPFTGAWIETSLIDRQLLLRRVAPFTGAWIET